jgi:hypothetical protein
LFPQKEEEEQSPDINEVRKRGNRERYTKGKEEEQRSGRRGEEIGCGWGWVQGSIFGGLSCE